MEKLPKHLDTQAKKAVAQVTDKMLRNKVARAIVAEKVVANPEALEAALQNALASGQLAEFLTTLSPEQKQQLRQTANGDITNSFPPGGNRRENSSVEIRGIPKSFSCVRQIGQQSCPAGSIGSMGSMVE
jgi:hypothetical protein